MGKNKKLIILTLAVILPGGFLALGLWKAYELTKKNKEGHNDHQ
jgi:hypothetical protein